MKVNNSKPPIPADAVVDLHLHTMYSDGFWSPTDLLDHLASRNFRVVAIVDHDTTVSVGRVGWLPGEVIGRRGIPGSRYIIDVDVLAIRVDPNAVLHIAAGRAVCHVDPVDWIGGDTIEVQSGACIAGKP